MRLNQKTTWTLQIGPLEDVEWYIYRIYALTEDAEKTQWVVLKCAIKRILYENHDSVTVGHYDVDKISSKYYL